MECSGYLDAEMDDSLSEIRGEIASLNANLSLLNLQRRQVLNDYLDLKGNIRVFCRVKPLIPDNRCDRLRSVVTTTDSSDVFLQITENKSKKYSFDKVFHPQSTQEQVFSEIEPVIKSALDGYNVCIFAYGQTGTGKTYSMEGRPNCPGVVLRGIEAMFEQALESNYEFLFTFSMLEIYMGSLRDLLVPHSTKARVHKAPRLSIKMDPNGGTEIENLVAIKVGDFEQVRRLYKLGSRFRSTASTMSNSTSSRSHCLIRISLTCLYSPERRRETNKIWMVDLGGSERLLKTQATGRRLEEGKAINLSLSALGDVISALQCKKQHVPYRNSKLTQVLRDSLGSDSKTIMLVHVSPKEEDMCETVCSLGFATRVASIHLGSEEPIEMRAKKEVAMAELLHKVQQLENERQDVKRNIERLDKRLEHLARPETSSEGHLEASIISTEGMQSIGAKNVKRVKDSTGASASLPGFMRPTICSQRKTGVDHQILRNNTKKPPVPRKTRKSSSVYAESVTYPAKSGVWQSDYGSECSIPTISHLKWKYRADDGTGCSQGASEYKIKKVIFPEQEISPRSLTTTSHESVDEMDEMVHVQVGTTDQNKQLIIDNWISHQMTEHNSTYWGKRVLAISTDNAINKYGEQSHESKIYKAEGQHCVSTRNLDTAMKEHMNFLTKEDLNFYVELNKAMIIDISPKNSTMDGKHTSPVDPSSEVTGGEYNQNNDSDRKIKFMPEHKQELVKCPQKIEVGSAAIMQTETPVSRHNPTSEPIFTEDLHGYPHHKEDAETYLRCMRSRRSLFMEKDLPILDQKNGALEEPIVSVNNFQEEKHILGPHQLLLQTVQMFWASVLLGLGIHSFGLGHDFFHGLMS